jgi:DNA-binding transcriptional ArsR family regulator
MALDGLDGAFAALANPHRREMVRLLGLHPHSISGLAALRGLSLPAINKHVRLLEEAGIVQRRKHGRTTFLTLDRTTILTLQAWFSQFHAYWGTDKESLENYAPYLASKPASQMETS